MRAFVQWLTALVNGQAEPVSQTLFYILIALLAAAEWIGGFAMLRVQMGIGGAVAGGVIGYAAGWRLLGLPLTFPGIIPTLLLTAALAGSGAWVAVRIYRFGVFCIAFTVGGCAALLFGASLPLSLLLGAVGGGVAAWLLRPAVIAITAFGGAAVLLQTAPAVFGYQCPALLHAVLTVPLSLLGCWLQTLASPPPKSKKKKRT